ncbi:MAG: hypoxanthine phosphoribosyltransferase [Eubacteriales bacterium]|nr:hypoxanthine phosphoribosyltransferase [Eubacteriales bacterium]
MEKKANISVLIPQDEVEAKIRELAEQISRDHEGETLHLICILKGGAYFMTELSKYMTIPVTVGFMSLSSYGSGTESSGIVKITKDLDDNIEGRHVMVVEDIIDTGNTLSYLIDMLKTRKPASVELCTLLNKPERRVKEVQVDYYGFIVPDKFIVGYGLDWDQKYRNLPYIGAVDFE